MNITPVQQGSQAWLDLRRTHDTASEAPAALGHSKYTSRTDLMKQKTTGMVEEVDPAKQRLFDRGHESEAMARPLAEAIIGSELYPITATLHIAGLNLLASLDGSTMDEEIIFEHKLWSEPLAEDVRKGTLSANYTLQMDQQLLVSGATKCLFMTSNGTAEKMAWCWYETTPEKKATLIAGWHQFHEDLAAYVPQEAAVAAVAAPQMGLPAVSITVNGSIALVDNLDKFGAALTAYVERINKKPETDQDFADLEASVKTLKTAEEALDAAESNALAQTESIDSMRRTVGLYRETARTNRLLIEKLVKVEKENRRAKIIADAVAAFGSHFTSLNVRLGKPYMPMLQPDFHGVVKGLKSLDSMKDKVAGELARCKIEANAIADKIDANLRYLSDVNAPMFLFADLNTVCMKSPDDFVMLVKARVSDHHAAEAVKEAATRERIRAEEQAKAEAKVAAEQAAFDKLERDEIARLAKLNATMIVEATPAVTHEVVAKIMMPPSVRQAMAPKVETAPTLALGEISTRLGFNVTSAFLAVLGFEATTVKAAKLFHEEDFPAICGALITHISEVSEQFDAVVA